MRRLVRCARSTRSAVAELAAIVDGLVGDARSLPANEFERRLQGRGAPAAGRRQARQKRSVRWRSWVERISGMFRGDFACDPLNAVKIDKRIQDEVDRLFAERVPDDCPDDPIEKQKYLAGLAVISLLLGHGAAVGQAGADRRRRRNPGRCGRQADRRLGAARRPARRRAARRGRSGEVACRSRSGRRPISTSGAPSGPRARRSDGCCGRCTRGAQSGL